jgi:hypothetical protein
MFQYFDKVAERIMDTGVSVRKRVIKIIRDMCMSKCEFRELADACVRMISRINDEETSIQVCNSNSIKESYPCTESSEALYSPV